VTRHLQGSNPEVEAVIACLDPLDRHPLLVLSRNGEMPSDDADVLQPRNTPLEAALDGREIVIPQGDPKWWEDSGVQRPESVGTRIALPVQYTEQRVIGVVSIICPAQTVDPSTVLESARRHLPRIAAEIESFRGQRLCGDYEAKCALVGAVTSTLLKAGALRMQAGEALERIIEAMDADAGAVRIVDGESLRLLSAVGIPDKVLDETLPTSVGIARDMQNARRPIAIERVSLHPSMAGNFEDEPDQFQFKSYAGAPMISDGIVRGILGIYTTRDYRLFTQADLGQLQIIADFLALAVLNQDLTRALNLTLSDLHRTPSPITDTDDESES